MTEACNPSSRAIGSFLVEYTAWLMGCGATCIRIEKNVGRIAASYGVRTEMTVMPRHIQLSVMDREDMECITLNVAVKAVVLKTFPIDFSLNTSLSELSWRIADRHIPLEEAIDIFRKITVEATGRKGKYVPLLVAAANPSMAELVPLPAHLYHRCSGRPACCSDWAARLMSLSPQVFFILCPAFL